MKKIFFILLLFFFANSQYAQAPQITVNIKDACGAWFQKNTNIGLFKVSGKDTVVVSTSTQNPAIFKNLDKTSYYIIKANVTDNNINPEIQLLDIVLLGNTILGIIKYNEIINYVGDVNGSGGASTLDAVLMSRELMTIQNNIPIGWNFIKIRENSSNSELAAANTIGIGILSSNNELNLLAARKGHLADASGLYCPGKCQKNKTDSIPLYYENIYVEKNKPIEIPFFTKLGDKISGSRIKVNSKQGKFISSPDFNSGSFIPSDSSYYDNIVFFNYVVPGSTNNGYKKVFSFKFLSKENGYLKDLIEINAESKVVAEIDDCLVELSRIIPKELTTSIPCITTWPKDITIPECSSTYPTGKPEISLECSGSFRIAYNDSIVGNCQKIFRKWIALNYTTLQTFEHTQIITINPTFNNYCNRNVTLNVSNGPKIITPTTLISNKNPSHLYSFSPVNPGDTTRVLTYDQSQFEEFHVYNLTTSEFCIATVVKTLCDSTIVNIRLRDILTVKNSNGYTVNARDFDIGSQHGCGTVKEFEISFDNGPFKPSLTFTEAYRGQTVLLRIRYKVNAAYFNYGTVKVWFLNENEPAPLELFVYDDFLKKGKEYTLAVQSQNFNAVFAFQLGIKIQDAVLNKCEAGSLKINYNEPIEGNLRVIFVDEKSIGNTISPDVPIFLIKLTPNLDGFTSEFLSHSEEVMPSEAVYFNQVSKVKMKILFPQRALTDSEDFRLEQQLKVYPNPVNSDDFHVVLPESFSNEVQISMFDIHGKICSASTKIIENKTLSLTLPMELKNGLYFLKIFDGKNLKSGAIQVMR